MRYPLLSLLFFYTLSISALTLSPQEAELIGKHIFFNECSEKKEKLVWWNQGEEFASMGIGHFIWYPEGKRGPFEETFPLLLEFLKQHQVPLPASLQTQNGCPWQSREEFLSSNKLELQELLLQTIPLQTQFIYERFQVAIEEILHSIEENKKAVVLNHLNQLQKSLNGKFALIDYLNFKGSGIAIQENYQGIRWGLKQVLETMPQSAKDPLSAFITTAKKLLTQRVEKAPPERHEEKWLPGWIARIERYQSK